MGVMVDPVNGFLENNRGIIVQGWGLTGFVCWTSEWKVRFIVYSDYLMLPIVLDLVLILRLILMKFLDLTIL